MWGSQHWWARVRSIVVSFNVKLLCSSGIVWPGLLTVDFLWIIHVAVLVFRVHSNYFTLGPQGRLKHDGLKHRLPSEQYPRGSGHLPLLQMCFQTKAGRRPAQQPAQLQQASKSFISPFYLSHAFWCAPLTKLYHCTSSNRVLRFCVWFQTFSPGAFAESSLIFGKTIHFSFVTRSNVMPLRSFHTWIIPTIPA